MSLASRRTSGTVGRSEFSVMVWTRRRRWFQFSLRSLLVGTVVLCLGLVWHQHWSAYRRNTDLARSFVLQELSVYILTITFARMSALTDLGSALDPNLQAIIDAWQTLPDSVKADILAILAQSQ